ncbi:inner centromere protein A [Sabethes cyaneus]|uniref:inner centromere protein A n=1 Tax=Sabethes cyaneus TaxID=53552 RepID=UPI00237E98D5|nr:inner centromere protein A [Sabethes cyaneus]
MSDSPRSILARLEQLKQWQEEQQRALLQKQIAQRELLSQEQQKMYAILGLGGKQSHPVESDGEREYELTNMQQQLVAEQEEHAYGSQSEEDSEDEPKPKPNNDESKPKVPPKPFLKRGEGLKARFKVDPNVFKLDNLPKYKYANLAKSRARKSKQQTRPELEKDKVFNRSRTERPQTTGNEPLTLDINRVQEKKLLKPPSVSDSKVVTDPANLVRSESEESLLPSIESLKKRLSVGSVEEVVPTLETPVQPDLPWKQQLKEDAAVLRQLKELKDLDLFELLEHQLASGNGSIASNASTLLRMLMENSIDVTDLLGGLTADSTLIPDNHEPLIEPVEDASCLEIHPVPDPKRHVLKETVTSDFDSSSTDSDDEETGQHVRFAEQEEPEIETDVESQLEAVNYSRMSTPKDDRGGRKSVEQMDDSTKSKTVEDTEQVRIREDILAKSELLKQRLAELDGEIESFRKENAQLMQMKQEHELEKNKLELDREEMMEKLNDERIKMEVYFHDERVKIEDERQKALKEAMRPTKKEKEEILRLKEQVADLQKEAKAKEAKHASSLARFRSQIKNLEKDLKETQLELDVMKKDNKKLETENARLKRQNNNRMLLEINKNIAKLAAPQSSVVDSGTAESRRNSSPDKHRKQILSARMKPIEVIDKKVAGKVAKAKVISHARNSTESRRSIPAVDTSSSSSSSEEEVEVETAEQKESSTTTDDQDDSDSKPADGSKSSYFHSKAKKNLFQGGSAAVKGDSSKVTPTAAAAADSNPETIELMKSLKREIVNDDGSRDIWYPNGNLKKISPDGLVIRMMYFNKDIKETNMNEGTTKYYYHETNTWHTTYLDGLEILEFPDGQTEHRFKDGSTEVHFPNGSIRTTNPNSVDIAEEWKYADGSTVIIKRNDDKVITLPNGQVEIHTKAHKRRIYPDGTTKFLYPDGSQESRYSNGRVRLKDKDGNLISDTGGT